MAPVPKYAEQLARLRRSLERFGEVDAGRVHDRDSHHYEDEVYGFFMNCHHLKDWLINDAAFSATKAEVEGFIDSSIELQLCADICNAHKHLKLTRPRSAEDPSMGKRKFFASFGDGPMQIIAKYTVDTNSGPIDAFELATKAVSYWTSFIKAKGGIA